jgi:hypothetical protein
MSILLTLITLALSKADFTPPAYIEGCDEANAIVDKMNIYIDEADSTAEATTVLQGNLDALKETAYYMEIIEDSLQSRLQSFLQIYDLATPITVLAEVTSTALSEELDALNSLFTQLGSTKDTTTALSYTDEIQELLRGMIKETEDQIEANDQYVDSVYSDVLPGLQEDYDNVSC